MGSIQYLDICLFCFYSLVPSRDFGFCQHKVLQRIKSFNAKKINRNLKAPYKCIKEDGLSVKIFSE